MNTRVEPLRAGLAILTTLGMVIAMVMTLAPHSALGHPSETQGGICHEGEGWSEHLGGETVNEDWGTATGTADTVEPGTVTYTVEDGYVVEFCLKAGDDHDHHVVEGPDSGVLTAPDGKELSHWAFRVLQEPVPEPESGWACIDGDVVFEEDREDFPEGTTIYDTEAEAAADGNCQDAPLPDRFVCDTENFVIVTVEPGDEGYEDAFDTQEEALAESDGCEEPEEVATTIPTEVEGTVITTSTTAPAVQVPTTAEVLDTEVEAEELPFTGIDSELLVGMAVLLLAGGLALLGVTGRREDT